MIMPQKVFLTSSATSTVKKIYEIEFYKWPSLEKILKRSEILVMSTPTVKTNHNYFWKFFNSKNFAAYRCFANCLAWDFDFFVRIAWLRVLFVLLLWWPSFGSCCCCCSSHMVAPGVLKVSFRLSQNSSERLNFDYKICWTAAFLLTACAISGK